MGTHPKFRIGPDMDSDGVLQLFSSVLSEIIGTEEGERKCATSSAAYFEMAGEESGQLETEQVLLHRASHIGPESAQKSENQDATFALRSGPNVIFALADGVGSSLGARLAAAVVVVEFCEYLRLCLRPSSLGASSAPFKKCKRFEIPPGLLLKWKTLQQPSIEELRAGIDGTNPTNWPARLTAELEDLRGGTFLHALRFCLDHASVVGGISGPEICRILAGVAQTMLTVDESLRRRNLDLAAKYLSKAQRFRADRHRDLIESARFAQESLDVVLDELIGNPNSQEFMVVRGAIPTVNALRFLENTKNPQRAFGPALATTMIGGLVAPSEQGDRLTAYILVIGDGVVERIDREHHVHSVVAMDHEVKTISTVISPGPISRAALQRESWVHAVEIGAGESLVVSSDGLARGHNELVSSKLSIMLGADLSAYPFFTATTLRDILGRAAHEADKLYAKNPQSSLFQDNLSLIVIHNKNEWAERTSHGTA